MSRRALWVLVLLCGAAYMGLLIIVFTNGGHRP